MLRDEDGRFTARIEGRNARWSGSSWEVPNATVFRVNGDLQRASEELFTDPLLNTSPRAFRRQTQDLDDLTREEARERVETLQAAGLPYRAALTQYYERIAFSLTPFIVALLSCSIGSRLKKNILLLSLLLSLVVSVGYYVIQMVLSLLAGVGGVPPIIGAFSGAAVFFCIGSVLLLRAKT